MSRLRTDPIKDARTAFQQEVKIQRVRLDMTQDELGERIGVCPSQISKLLANPDSINVGRLRGIIAATDLGPTTILSLLGYSPKEIRDFKEKG